MTDKPARPVLRLKTGSPPSRGPSLWRCKPCGGPVALTGQEADGDVIRCPTCNARLGTAAKFHSDPPQARARPDTGTPPPPAKGAPTPGFRREVKRPSGVRRPIRPA